MCVCVRIIVTAQTLPIRSYFIKMANNCELMVVSPEWFVGIRRQREQRLGALDLGPALERRVSPACSRLGVRFIKLVCNWHRYKSICALSIVFINIKSLICLLHVFPPPILRYLFLILSLQFVFCEDVYSAHLLLTICTHTC